MGLYGSKSATETNLVFGMMPPAATVGGFTGATATSLNWGSIPPAPAKWNNSLVSTPPVVKWAVFKTLTMKRRSSVIGKRGAGKHQVEPNRESRPAGKIKPVISRQKHGKMIEELEHQIMPDFAGARRVFRGCLLFGGIMAIVCLLLFCSAVKAQGQPDIEFKSLFQIRAALPDTVLLIHTGYNIRVNKSGVECVPLNADTPPGPPIPVQNWLQGDSGEWIGVTRSGATVTLFNCCGASMYLEIETPGQVVDFYNMVPGVLHWKERPKQ